MAAENKYDEKSCGAVISDRAGRYLLIENRCGNVGFPKGHVEDGETETETALREIFEETALKPRLIDGFRSEYSYTLENGKTKLGVYFLALCENTEPRLAQGEIGRCWIEGYERARGLLTYEADRRILDAAEEYLTKNKPGK